MSNVVSVKVHKKIFGSATRKSVMIYFADKASDGGEGIWASKTTIAAELELHRATVIRTINELVEEGILIAVGDRRHRNGSTVEYDICMQAVAALPDVKVIETGADMPREKDLTRRTERPVAQRDPSHTATPPVAQRDTMMSHSATQTILKPSNNLSAGARGDPRPATHRTPAVRPDPSRQHEVLMSLAERIRNGAYVAPSALTPNQARMMLAERWVDTNQLRSAGIAF